jgi:hypothetical protein
VKAAVVALAVALAATALLGAVRLLRPSSGPAKSGLAKPFLFPPGDRARVDRLRDRLAAGLLSLRTRDGDYSSRPDGGDVVPVDRVEATAFGLAGLAVARRMGARAPGLDAAISAARGVLVRGPPGGVPRGPARASPEKTARALAVSTLALSLAADPADATAVDLVAKTLVYRVTMTAIPGGWIQGVTARAFAQLVEDGREPLLGDAPLSAFPSRRVELGRHLLDEHLSQALVEEIQRGLGAPPSALADAVWPRVLADPPVWAEEQTDLYSMTLAAWFAARRPGGEAWYRDVVPVLEAGVRDDGVIPGTYSGFPVSRTACALLILWEGCGLRPADAP